MAPLNLSVLLRSLSERAHRVVFYLVSYFTLFVLLYFYIPSILLITVLTEVVLVSQLYKVSH